jgi:DNA mismatch repair protein MutS2
LAIARRLGVEEAILAEAERTLPEAERTLDALLAAVEERARELEMRDNALQTAAEAVRVERDIVETRGAALENREREVRARAAALESDAREQSRAYLLEARRRVEEALAIARAAVDEATAKEARRLVESALAQTDTETREEGRGKGEGWLSLEDLRRLRQAASPSSTARPPDRPTARVPSTEVEITAATEISLRGLRIDEAEAKLIRALDDAVLAELPYLRVIHGKGTGAVRQLVHDIVARDARVERFAFAPANQGGSGVTVLEFRR